MWSPGGQLDLLTFAGMRGGGGKGYVPPPSPAAPPPTYADPVTGKTYTTPELLNQGITDRQNQEKIDAKAKSDQAALDKQTAHTTWTGTRDTAINNARSRIEQSYRDAGVDPANYKTEIDSAVRDYSGRVVEDDPNVASVFPSNLGETIVGNSTTARRTAQQSAYDKIFDPNYATTNLSNTLLDPQINTILDQQFNPLSEQLNRAHLRGTLNDQGYGAATDLLGTKRTAGSSAVRSLGETILGNERKDLNDYITGGRNTAANLKLGDAFDPTTYKTGAEGMINTDVSGLGGALSNAVGGTRYADINDLLNAGGAAQGSTNPTVANPNDQTLGANILEDSKKRGLGSQGAF